MNSTLGSVVPLTMLLGDASIGVDIVKKVDALLQRRLHGSMGYVWVKVDLEATPVFVSDPIF